VATASILLCRIEAVATIQAPISELEKRLNIKFD
jgi:hypothetical protein